MSKRLGCLQVLHLTIGQRCGLLPSNDARDEQRRRANAQPAWVCGRCCFDATRSREIAVRTPDDARVWRRIIARGEFDSSTGWEQQVIRRQSWLIPAQDWMWTTLDKIGRAQRCASSHDRNRSRIRRRKLWMARKYRSPACNAQPVKRRLRLPFAALASCDRSDRAASCATGSISA